MARIAGRRAADDGSPAAVLETLKDESRGEKRGKWGGGDARACGALSKTPEARGGEEGDRGERGGAAVSAGREGEIGGGRLEKVKLTGGPGLSAGERERGRGRRPAGPRAMKKGRGARELGQKAEKEGGERIPFSFSFFI